MSDSRLDCAHARDAEDVACALLCTDVYASDTAHPRSSRSLEQQRARSSSSSSSRRWSLRVGTARRMRHAAPGRHGLQAKAAVDRGRRGRATGWRPCGRTTTLRGAASRAAASRAGRGRCRGAWTARSADAAHGTCTTRTGVTAARTGKRCPARHARTRSRPPPVPLPPLSRRPRLPSRHQRGLKDAVTHAGCVSPAAGRGRGAAVARARVARAARAGARGGKPLPKKKSAENHRKKRSRATAAARSLPPFSHLGPSSHARAPRT